MRIDGIPRLIAPFNSVRVILFVIAILLAAAGVSWDWIRLPYSYLRSFNVGFAPSGPAGSAAAVPVSQGLVFIFIVLAAATAGFSGFERLRKLLAGLALACLFYHALYLACIDGRWIETFVAQADSFRLHNQFLSTYFIANGGADSSQDHISVFEYFVPDRLLFAWQALGRGWILALVGAFLLAAAPEARPSSRALPWVLFAAAPAAALLIALFGARVLWGEYLHYAGDRQLSEGAYASALGSYTEAMAADPILAHSEPFMLKVSKAHYALNGPHEPYAMLYLASRDINSKNYDEGFARLRILASMPLGDSPFRASYIRTSAKTERAGYVTRGLSHYQRNDKAQAQRDLQFALGIDVAANPQPVHVNFMLARIERDLHEYAACADRAEKVRTAGTVTQRAVVADLYTTAGDCYVGMDQFSLARRAYFSSFDRDSRNNYRANQALSGL